MSLKLTIPTPLRRITRDADVLDVEPGTVQEIIALRDAKIAKFNVEDLLDQRILQKVVQSGYVEEIERRYKLRP